MQSHPHSRDSSSAGWRLLRALLLGLLPLLLRALPTHFHSPL
jgi:hypothetical protein